MTERPDTSRPESAQRTWRVGLTGGIASGKSAVADMFAGLGVPVIDTDLIAREVVSPGSPAAQAGLEPGDTITAVGERAVERAWQLRHALGAHYAGDEVELSVSRGTERKTLTLTLGAPPGAGK